MFFFIFASICQFLRGFPTRLGLSLVFSNLQWLLLPCCFSALSWKSGRGTFPPMVSAKMILRVTSQQQDIENITSHQTLAECVLQLQICRICSSLGKSGRSWAKLGHDGLSWSLRGATFPEQARTLA